VEETIFHGSRAVKTKDKIKENRSTKMIFLNEAEGKTGPLRRHNCLNAKTCNATLDLAPGNPFSYWKETF